MEFYYRQKYPHVLVQRLLVALNPNGVEIIIRISTDIPPIRHNSQKELYQLLMQHRPLDGAHVSVGGNPEAAFVLDVDNDRKNMPNCACGGGRSICDNCWVAMIGALRCYIYIFRAHFSCSYFLPCFSGGRGLHLFVLDSSKIDRAYAMHMLKTIVSDALRAISNGVVSLVSKFTDGRAFSLCAFEPPTQIQIVPLDPLVLSLYREIMLPFFEKEWIPRVLGANATFEHGINAAKCLITSSSELRAFDISSQMLTRARIERKDRIDAFMVIATLLWQSPDSNLSTETHPLRLPWSPHQRSGNFSLPMDMDHMFSIYPQSHPPKCTDVGKPGTMGDSMFNQSIAFVQDLLDNYESRPRALIWPT